MTARRGSSRALVIPVTTREPATGGALRDVAERSSPATLGGRSTSSRIVAATFDMDTGGGTLTPQGSPSP
jgi:hypothetical protein